MRKTLTLLLLAASMLSWAQSVTYYLPKTNLRFRITYTEVTSHQGPFYQYSERFLGTKDVVTESGVNYELKSVTMETFTTADTDRPLLYTPGKTHSQLQLTSKGILSSLNGKETRSDHVYDATNAKAANDNHNHNDNEVKKERVHMPAILPLTEEGMLATSLSKQAEAAARQIYRIREARLALLSGEADHLPADGEAMRITLERLDRQEEELVLLFIGEKTTRTLHKTISLSPGCEEYKDDVLFRFSQHEGPVNRTDLSGEPVYLTIAPSFPTAPAVTTGDKQDGAVYYNLPGQGEITVRYGERKLLHTTKTIAQYGRTMMLTEGKKAQEVHFNTKTGAILRAE